MTWAAMQGDAVDALRLLVSDSVDAIVTDLYYLTDAWRSDVAMTDSVKIYDGSRLVWQGEF